MYYIQYKEMKKGKKLNLSNFFQYYQHISLKINFSNATEF